MRGTGGQGGHHEIDGVGQEPGHPVALQHPPRRQGVGHPGRRPPQVAVVEVPLEGDPAVVTAVLPPQ